MSIRANIQSRYGLAALVLLLYVVSLLLPAVDIGKNETVSGGIAVAYGYVALLGGQPAWLANPALLIALVFLIRRRWNRAAIAGALAVILMLGTLASVGPRPDRQTGPVFEFHLAILGFGPGYFCWLASGVALAAGSWGRHIQCASERSSR